MAAKRSYPKGTVALSVGTKRGLFLLTSKDRRTWKVEEPSLVGYRVYHAAVDMRNGTRMYAAANNDFFGSGVRYSDDFGRTWKEPEKGIAFVEGSSLSLKRRLREHLPRRPHLPHSPFSFVEKVVDLHVRHGHDSVRWFFLGVLGHDPSRV